MNTLKNISQKSIAALIEAISTLSQISTLSDFDIGIIQGRISCCFELCETNNLLKNKIVFMYLFLPYKEQQHIKKMVDSMKIQNGNTDNKIIDFRQNS